MHTLSLVSDWNHGNAHFLRGIASELVRRGQTVDVYEPLGGWSLQNLRQDHGDEPLHELARVYPHLHSQCYDLKSLDLDKVLDGADVVIVHEWNEPALIERIGRHRAAHDHYRLLFHDTHHRLVTAPQEMERYDLRHFDGVLAFGGIIRDLYLQEMQARRAWTWHEAADVEIFRPTASTNREGDLVWIGNWGDDERSGEIEEFLIGPVRRLGLKARVYGVRYPQQAMQKLHEAGIEYGGWLPNYRVPEVFGQFAVTLHIPRRPYRESIPGIPTIRMFEALACGIPLVSLPWEDTDGLFHEGDDYLIADSGDEMTERIRQIFDAPQLAAELAAHGRRTILERHTCAHRVDELLQILAELDRSHTARPAAPTAAGT